MNAQLELQPLCDELPRRFEQYSDALPRIEIAEVAEDRTIEPIRRTAAGSCAAAIRSE